MIIDLLPSSTEFICKCGLFIAFELSMTISFLFIQIKKFKIIDDVFEENGNGTKLSTAKNQINKIS